MYFVFLLFFFFKQKTAYEMRISDWSSDVCSSDLLPFGGRPRRIILIDQSDNGAWQRLPNGAGLVARGGIARHDAAAFSEAIAFHDHGTGRFLEPLLHLCGERRTTG